MDDIDEMIQGITEATRDAVAAHHAAGRATCHIIDGNIVWVHPDGRQEIVRPIERK